MIAYPSMILAEPALIHYWMMNARYGTQEPDSKGSAPCTAYGTTPPIPGRAGIPAGGTCWKFNGAGAAAHDATGGMRTAASFATGGVGLSVEAWFLATPSLNVVSQFIAGWQQVGSWTGDVYTAGPNVAWYMYDGSSGRTATSSTPWALGSWNHAVGTATNGALQVYLNGSLAGTTAAGPPYNLTNALQFTIGGSLASQGVQAADATFPIDEVAVYAAVLPAATVLRHYLAGTSWRSGRRRRRSTAGAIRSRRTLTGRVGTRGAI